MGLQIEDLNNKNFLVKDGLITKTISQKLQFSNLLAKEIIEKTLKQKEKKI